MNNPVGELIREKRLERAWSQEQLGYRAKIDQTRLSKIERGVKHPSDTELSRLEAALEARLSG